MELLQRRLSLENIRTDTEQADELKSVRERLECFDLGRHIIGGRRAVVRDERMYTLRPHRTFHKQLGHQPAFYIGNSEARSPIKALR